MQHKDIIIIKKVISEARMAVDLLGNVSLEHFKADEMQKRAVCMTIVNIGELVKGLDMEVRRQYPSIPWKAMAGFRDVTAHRYQSLNMEDVYITVKREFPIIIDNMLKIKFAED